MSGKLLGFDSTVILLTLAFAVVVGAICFCLGYFLLDLELRLSVLIAAGLGVVQSIGSLYYIWRRFVRPGPPPRRGGHPG